MALNANSEEPRQPISLLMVTNSLARGGAEAMVVRLALGLDAKRVRPVVVCLKEAGALADRLTERAVPVHAGLLRHKYDVGVVKRLVGLIVEYAPACVMAVGNGGDRMFWSALAARRAGAAMLVWAHIFPTRRHRTFEWLNRRLYRWVDAFVAVGERHRESLIELEGVPAERLHVIRNGIDVAEFARPGQSARATSGIPLSRPTVIAIIANLRADKRHDVFIEAAGRVKGARPACEFWIIGDGPERQAVERMARKHDPDGRWIKLLGARDDVPALLNEIDIVCLTSDWHEALSIAMLEAMAAGKAFVAPRIGSLDEALTDGLTGRVFEPFTPEALAAVLIELIDDPKRRMALGEAAARRVREGFTAELMAREFEALVQRLWRERIEGDDAAG